MTTLNHSKDKRYRNLHRAIPVAVKVKTNLAWERETKEMVDRAYQLFWQKRNKKPPRVSEFRLHY